MVRELQLLPTSRRRFKTCFAESKSRENGHLFPFCQRFLRGGQPQRGTHKKTRESLHLSCHREMQKNCVSAFLTQVTDNLKGEVIQLATSPLKINRSKDKDKTMLREAYACR